MSSTLVFRNNSPNPTEDTAMVPAGSGGSWAAGTYSFLLVAWFRGADETNHEGAGWIKSVPSEWENKTIVNNGIITIDWIRPIGSLQEERLPSHYTVYVQTAASFDLASAANICWTSAAGALTIDGTAESATLYKDSGSSEAAFTAAATSITVNPVLNMDPILRPQTVRGYDGRLVRKSYAHLNPVQSIDFSLVGSSMTLAEYQSMMDWILYSTPIRVTDNDGTAAILHYFGRLTDGKYLGTLGKNTRDIFPLHFEVETGTIN
jgi:hypothetical protein